MKGKNTIKLNAETMLEAVQMWVDSAITAKPRVVDVRQIKPTPLYQDGKTVELPGYYEVDVGEELPSESPASFVRGVA